MRSSVFISVPNPWPSFPLLLADSEALHCSGDSVAEASGASEATSLAGRWGRGGKKLRELPAMAGARGGHLSRYLLAHRPPLDEDFCVVSFASSGFHFLIEAPKPLGSRRTLDLDGG